MSSSSIIPPTNPQITSTPVSSSSSSGSSSSSSSSSSGAAQIAGNYTEFLQLLTTQLQNQDPLDPLDTNQFTQQLVSFAQVEQQLNMNDQLTTLVKLQQASQGTQALAYVGATVAVNGSTTQMTNSQASWNYTVASPATISMSIANSAGQTVYTSSSTAQTGAQTFTWNGVGNDGTQWPDGAYTMSITATGANGQSVGVSTQVVGTVNSVDLTKNPPAFSIEGQSYTLSQIQQIVAPASSSALSSLSTQISNLSSLLTSLTGG